MDEQIRLDPRMIRPQELEREPLSGQTVTVRSHQGGSIGFRGKEYKPGKDQLIKNVPVEAVAAIEGATFWQDKRTPFTIKCDVVVPETK
jgi:hypothetical protein